jgi:hypothetical protein
MDGHQKVFESCFDQAPDKGVVDLGRNLIFLREFRLQISDRCADHPLDAALWATLWLTPRRVVQESS